MKRESRPYVTTANAVIIGNVAFAVLNASRITENALIQIAIRLAIFREGRMKIKVIETVTEIEATASEISASQTVAGRFASVLANALTPYRAYDKDDENDAERQEE